MTDRAFFVCYSEQTARYIPNGDGSGATPEAERAFRFPNKAAAERARRTRVIPNAWVIRSARTSKRGKVIIEGVED